MSVRKYGLNVTDRDFVFIEFSVDRGDFFLLLSHVKWVSHVNHFESSSDCSDSIGLLIGVEFLDRLVRGYHKVSVQ